MHHRNTQNIDLECTVLFVKFMTNVACDFSLTFVSCYIYDIPYINNTICTVTTAVLQIRLSTDLSIWKYE